MSRLRELVSELRELGPGTLMLVLGAMFVIGVLTLLAQVYPDSATINVLVNLAAIVTLILATGLVGFGIWFIYRSSTGNLLEVGMIGRQFLDSEEVLRRLQDAQSILITKTWFPETDDIATALTTALKRGARIKLILCHPESDILRVRCEGAGVTLDTAVQWIVEGLRIVHDCAKSEDQFDGIAFHNVWPGCPVIRVDERVYMGFYFRGDTSPSFPWIEIKNNSRIGRQLRSQEEELWRAAEDRLDGLESLRAWLESHQ